MFPDRGYRPATSGIACRGFDFGLRRLGVFLLLGKIIDHDIGPFAGEEDGDAAADSRIASGDQRGFAFELAGRFVLRAAKFGLQVQIGFEAGLVELPAGNGGLGARRLPSQGHRANLVFLSSAELWISWRWLIDECATM